MIILREGGRDDHGAAAIDEVATLHAHAHTHTNKHAPNEKMVKT